LAQVRDEEVPVTSPGTTLPPISLALSIAQSPMQCDVRQM